MTQGVLKGRGSRAVCVGCILLALVPAAGWALTGGPSEPTASAPVATGVDSLVDPFTGDFQYSIPLVELPGPHGSYPFSMSYRSGISTNAEASWVGLGWTFEPGRISRTVRGAPDDVAGDEVNQVFRQRPATTVGGGGTVGVEGFGLDSRLLTAGASVGLDVFFDSYSGYGMALNLGPRAAVKVFDRLGGSLGVTADLNTHQGTTVNGSLGFNLGMDHINPSFGGSFSPRTGLQSAYWALGKSGAIPIPLFEPSYLPAQQRSQLGTRRDFSIKVGGELWGLFVEGRVNGYFGRTDFTVPSKRRVFGYLYLHEGVGAADSPQLDFVREKDAPLKPKTPSLPVAILTNDVFDVASGGPSGPFRAYRNDLPILGDPSVANVNISTADAAEIGLGAYAHGGGSSQGTVAQGAATGWTDNTFARTVASSFPSSTGERVYFAFTNEPGSDFPGSRSGHPEVPRYVQLTTATDTTDKTEGLSAAPSVPPLRSDVRSRASFIRAVTEAEASSSWSNKFAYPGIERPSIAVSDQRIAGFEILTADGTRYVFAQPAYVTRETNCSFSVHPGMDGATFLPGQSTIKLPTTVSSALSSWWADPSANPSLSQQSTTDQFLSCTTSPPYAHSYHLTSILGPTYVDADGTIGPSDGDLGHWVRFEYLKVQDYAYRSPYVGAHYSRGYEDSYLIDDRGSLTYGQKDFYVLQRAWTASHEVKFTTENRLDAFGAKSLVQNSPMPRGRAAKKLIRIALYRRGDAVPIKTVNLEHHYQLAPGTPNSAATGGPNDETGGKLTLTRLWFEYSTDRSGGRSPFVFSYGSQNPKYQEFGRDGDTNSDRWGYYQPCRRVRDFPEAGSGTDRCSNAEIPYTSQTPDTAEQAAAWSLRSINTPSGANVNVTYEPDDYAYVQAERAAIMLSACSGPIALTTSTPEICINFAASGLSTVPSTKAAAEQLLSRMLKDATGVTRPVAFSAELQLRSKEGSSCPQGCSCDAERDIWGPVSGYLELRDITKPYRVDSCPNGICTAYLQLKPVKSGGVDYHPLAFAGWQHVKFNQPQYGVPGVTPMGVTSAGDAALKTAAEGLVNMVLTIHDTFKNYSARAAKACWARTARNVRLRLFEPTGRKVGGGVRVKKVTICDAHAGVDCSLAVTRDDPRYSIGKTYTYTIDENNQAVSSGVAAYEPSVGGDEISVRRPEFFDEKRIRSPDDPAYIEHPVAESLFPAPTVGYRRVVERTIAADLAAASPNQGIATLGERVHEFYTAKEFPVRIRASGIRKPKPVQSILPIYGIGALLHEQFGASQGYRIELNDMHGKPRRVIEYSLKPDGRRADGADRETMYLYNTSALASDRLDSAALEVYSQGAAVDTTLGQRVEYYADMRKSTSSTNSMGVSINVDTIFVVYPIPIPVPWPSYDDSVKESRTSVFHQVVHQNGMVTGIQTRTGSATSVSRNLAFDPARGSPILTSQTNAFQDPIYDLRVPAYWLHPEMGPAYVDERRPNLLSNDAVALRSAANPLQAPKATCCDPSYVETRRVTGVLDASLTLHWNRDLIDEALFYRHAPALANEAWEYTRGHKGPWRPIASYRVDTARNYSEKPTPRTDGRFARAVMVPLSELPKDAVGVFQGLIGSCAKGWVEAERFLKYHPQGPAISSATPLERQDALLYGRRGSVVQAVAQGAAYDQVGYEGFESYPSGVKLRLEDLDDGNIDFWADPTASPMFTAVDTIPGRLEDGLVVWPAFPRRGFGKGDVDPIPPDAKISFETHLGETLLLQPTFGDVRFVNGEWIGVPQEPLPFSDREVKISFTRSQAAVAIKTPYAQPKYFWPWFTPDPRVEVTDREAHTGTRSLAVHGNVAFRQTRLFNHADTQPSSGTFVLSAWVRRHDTDVATYASGGSPESRLAVGVVVGGVTTQGGDSTGGTTVLFDPIGPIIDGWQRVEGEFSYSSADALTFVFQSGNKTVVYLDDIRVFPRQASLQTFVYDPRTLQLAARLDDNNVATRWRYDDDGRLRIAERETARGWRTVTEHMNHQTEPLGTPARN